MTASTLSSATSSATKVLDVPADMWDPAPVKKELRDATKKVVDAVAPVAAGALLAGAQAAGAAAKLTPYGASVAPTIDLCTATVAPIAIPAAVNASKPCVNSAVGTMTDKAVDGAHKVSKQSKESKKSKDCSA